MTMMINDELRAYVGHLLKAAVASYWITDTLRDVLEWWLG